MTSRLNTGSQQILAKRMHYLVSFQLKLLQMKKLLSLLYKQISTWDR